MMRKAVKDAFYEEFGENYGGEIEEYDGLISYQNDYAADGKFETLEDKLVALNVPFDRWSAGDGSYCPESREYRPKNDLHDEIDTELCLACDGMPYIEVGELNAILAEDISAEEKLEKIKTKIADNDYCEFPLEREPKAPLYSIWLSIDNDGDDTSDTYDINVWNEDDNERVETLEQGHINNLAAAESKVSEIIENNPNVIFEKRPLQDKRSV
jgi:hypothetical protein